MSAYAEDAYGKAGYFIMFLLYFFSLAIGNVAIAISAVGYLATFFPWLSATPIATCISVIALIWLTTVANFGGPSITGTHRRDHGVGRHHPGRRPVDHRLVLVQAARPSRQAWNPQGMSLGEGVGSSISLTLWAFLGMESAAQNSDAVENPKRNVPLACMFGTLGAAVDLHPVDDGDPGHRAERRAREIDRPVRPRLRQMFSPTVGSIIMALAVIACLGSLLGWQFTIAQTAKAAADDAHVPAASSRR